MSDYLASLSSTSLSFSKKICDRYFHSKRVYGDSNSSKVSSHLKPLEHRRSFDTGCDKITKINKPSFLSSRTKNKIRQKGFAWFYAKKKRNPRHPFTFITLTYTDKVKHSHKECNVMLNTFLTRLRSICNFSYIWVNELQKNGNIHYHIIADTYFNIRTINYYWLKILSYNGYKTLNSAGKDLNPVDIRNKTDFSNKTFLLKYLSKYVSKSKDKIFARRWGCNRLISRLCTKVVISLTEKDFNLVCSTQKIFKDSKLLFQSRIITDFTKKIKVLPIVRPYARILLKYFDEIAEYNNSYVFT